MHIEPEALRSPNFLLRSLEVILSILTFSLVAQQAANYGGSELDFVVFTGVTAFLLCLAFMVCYLLDVKNNSIFTLVELIINIIWWFFWIAAASCLADIINKGAARPGGDMDKVKAACAFAWITWAAWTVSTFISIKEVMHGRGQ